MRHLLPAIILVFLQSLCLGQLGELKGTTVIVVRHAEKMDSSDDPDLSDTGKKRAVLLSRLLGEADVAALFSSQYKRTQQTLLPLARKLNLEIITVNASMTDELVRKMLTEFPGKTIVVASHSDKVTEIIEALGGRSVGFLDEFEYDSLFVVTLLDNSVAGVLHLKY
jgi:2,3-bisphosphoglycerate-dependent phosphoglycerate mutase